MKPVTFLAVLLPAVTAALAQYTVLHTFYNSGTVDGRSVAGPLTGDANGTLYGMTTSGGLSNRGVIFSIRTNGMDYTVLHDFNAVPNDGLDPRNNSLVLADGIFVWAQRFQAGAMAKAWSFPSRPTVPTTKSSITLLMPEAMGGYRSAPCS
jgi:uncharacterized repeat protein (TIGR03803 family)